MKIRIHSSKLIPETERTTICGQSCVFSAHAGRPLCGARPFVARKTLKEVASRAMIIKLQLKLMPRRANLASLTLYLSLCEMS